MFRRGYLGVDGFFLLSGLLLAHAHPALGASRAELRRFWTRRLARIYPVHLAVLGLFALLLAAGAALGYSPRDPDRFEGRELALSLLLLHGWGFSARWAWNYPSWSISTEWLGYLLFPAAWLCVRRLPASLALALAAACLATLFAVQRGQGVGLNLTYGGPLERFAPEFVAGMAAARLAPAIRAPGRAVVLAGAAWLAAGLAWGSDAWAVPGLLLALTGLLVNALQGRGPLLAWAPGAVRLGELSYAFYMSFALVETVQALLWRILRLAPPERPAAYAAVATVATLALAALLRRFVELPGLRLASRRASV